MREEDVVFLRACADDFDEVNPNKEPGHSPEVEIHIVGRNALEIVLNQEQAGVQQELLRLREKEREAMKKVTEAENRLKKAENLNTDDQEKLLQAEQLQQQIRERVGTEKEGLRSDVKRILDGLKSNGMEKTAAQERMKDVAREIERLAENELQQIEPRLTNARKLAELLEEKTARRNARPSWKRAPGMRSRKLRASEDAASKKEREAAEAEKKAEASGNDADKVRQQREARLQRQRAEELRKRRASCAKRRSATVGTPTRNAILPSRARCWPTLARPRRKSKRRSTIC